MAEERFAAFDWAASAPWQAHIQNIFPTPTPAQLQKIKRKWYIQHIDSTLSLEPAPAPTAPKNQEQHHGHSHDNAHGHAHSKVMLAPAFLFSLWPLAWIFGKGMLLSAIACLAGVLCKYGKPSLTKAYWRAALWDDDLHTFIFSLFFIFYPNRSVAHFPIALSALIWASGAMCTAEVPESLRSLAQKVDRFQTTLMKGHCEIALGCYLLISVFTPSGSIFEVILYWQFLRVKYILSGLLQATFKIWRERIDSFIGEKPLLKPVWTKLTRFGEYMVSTDRKQGQCTVM